MRKEYAHSTHLSTERFAQGTLLKIKSAYFIKLGVFYFSPWFTTSEFRFYRNESSGDGRNWTAVRNLAQWASTWLVDLVFHLRLKNQSIRFLSGLWRTTTK